MLVGREILLLLWDLDEAWIAKRASSNSADAYWRESSFSRRSPNLGGPSVFIRGDRGFGIDEKQTSACSGSC